jgi:ketosteroid isomerase-like protein
MSNADKVRAMYDAVQTGDMATASELLHPEVVWDVTRSPVEDLRGVYEGPEGTVRLWSGWLDAWESISIPEPDYVEAGQHVVAWSGGGQVNRGRSSGIEVEMEAFGWVWTFEGGRIVRATMYTDRDEALSAAGLGDEQR